MTETRLLDQTSRKRLWNYRRGVFIEVVLFEARHGGAWRLLCEVPLAEADSM